MNSTASKNSNLVSVRDSNLKKIEEKSSKEKLVEKSFVGKKERLDQKVSNRISVVRVNDIDHEWAKSFDFSLPRYTLPEYNGWPYFPRDCPFDSLEFLFREITLLFRVHRWLKISPPRAAHELLRLNAYAR